MANITFTEASGLQNSIYGNSQAPIKMFIEKKAEAFEQESIIKNTINQIIRQYSKEELLKDAQRAQDEICKSLQKTYGTDYIVGVNFSTLTAQ